VTCVQVAVTSCLVLSPNVKIGIVSDYYYPQLGGITEHVHGQATELAHRGHDVTVITPRLAVTPQIVDGDDVPHRDFRVVRVGRAFPFYANGAETLVTLAPGLPFALDRLYRRLRFDVLHVHNPFGALLPLTAILRSPAPVTVGTFHSVVPEGYRPLRAASGRLQGVFARLDASVAVSDAVVDSLRPHFPALEFVTIPNGIDTDFFRPDAPPLPALTTKRTIVFVGRFDPRNGVKHMIGAFSHLRSRRCDVQLVLVGDGPLRPLVERMVRTHLRDDIVFAGRVNRLRPRYLTSADIVCTPCGLRSFGMVLLEAMSCARPVVATRLPGFEFVMRDGIDGIMVDRADNEIGFATALDGLLDDPVLARTLGDAGRERALTTFAWPIVADQLERLYQQLAMRRSLTLADVA